MKEISCQENVKSLAKGHLQETTFLTQTTKQKEDNFQTLEALRSRLKMVQLNVLKLQHQHLER